MRVKKLLVFSMIALMIGAFAGDTIAAEPVKKPAGGPPLLDLKSEAKKQALKDTRLKQALNSEIVNVTAVEDKPSKPKPKKSKNPKWSYSGQNGPEHWGDLSDNYATCKTGKNQSPVNLMDPTAVGTTNLPGFDVFYRDSYLKIVNDGKLIKVNYPLGSYIKVNDHRYELLHLRFRTPSEHQVNGFNYPMELQLVHKDGFGNLAVIAIIFQEGEHNELLEQVIRHLPRANNKQQIHRSVTLNPSKFFPQNRQFYKYSGSMTTPPCEEGVYWMVFKHPIQASAEQIQKLNEATGDNARPIMKLNARSILKSWSDTSQEGAQYEFYY